MSSIGIELHSIRGELRYPKLVQTWNLHGGLVETSGET
jgi:hypothetical protein